MRFNQLLLTICILQLLGCANDNLEDQVDCSQSSLELTLAATTDASSCLASDGMIAVSVTGGSGPYTFTLGATTNTTGQFQNITAGSYEVTVKDALGCERNLIVELSAVGSNLSLEVVAVADTQCVGNNGSITATVQGGIAPFEFSLNGGAFGSASSFSNLAPGNYSVKVKDSEGCFFVRSTTVDKGSTSISFANEIKPIISANCAIPGCHNGDNGATINWTVFANVKAKAALIKTRTGNRSMPLTGSLTQNEIDLIACWVDDGALNN